MAHDTKEYLRQVYADKETKYYHGHRPEMFQYIPRRVHPLDRAQLRFFTRTRSAWRYYQPLSILPIPSLKNMRFLHVGLRAVVA